MKSLFNAPAYDEILQRIDNLKYDSTALWGKMNVAQMLAHCSKALETATGDTIAPRILLGRIISPFIKSMYYSDKEWSKNSPTAPSFVVTNGRDFEKEKAYLKALIRKFNAGGSQNCTKNPHSFFGKLTPEQWSMGMYKHLDHHLKQFGV